MVKRAYVPERGDAIWLSFAPQVGHEQAGRRPALVISPASYNGKVGLGLFCPMSNQTKGYSWEVPIPNGHKVAGVVLADQLKSFDWKARKAAFICKPPDAIVVEVCEKLAPLVEPEREGKDEEVD